MSRRFRGQRGIRTMVRTAHIGGVVVFMGAILGGGFSVVGGVVLGLTGVYLVVDQLIRDGSAHIRFAVFWAVVLKISALTVGFLHAAWLVPCLWFCLIVGGLISHAPGSVRHFSLWGEGGPCARRLAPSTQDDIPGKVVRFDTVPTKKMCHSPRVVSPESVRGSQESA